MTAPLPERLRAAADDPYECTPMQMAALLREAADALSWRPISTVFCNDTEVLMYFNDHRLGRYGCEVVDADHDSQPEYWRANGATHWVPLPRAPEDEP